MHCKGSTIFLTVFSLLFGAYERPSFQVLLHMCASLLSLFTTIFLSLSFELLRRLFDYFNIFNFTSIGWSILVYFWRFSVKTKITSSIFLVSRDRRKKTWQPSRFNWSFDLSSQRKEYTNFVDHVCLIKFLCVVSCFFPFLFTLPPLLICLLIFTIYLNMSLLYAFGVCLPIWCFSLLCRRAQMNGSQCENFKMC